MSEVVNEKNRRKYYIILSEAEKKLLSFFVKEKDSTVQFIKLRRYCIIDLDMDTAEFYEAYTSLLKKEILVDISANKEHTIIISRLVDIPTVVKYYLNLKYYDSAVILAALFKLFFYPISKGIECEFTLWDILHSKKLYKIRQKYEDNNAIFRQFIHELIEKNYLKFINNKRYILNYKAVPNEVVPFLLL
ncbi:MAG: hypothetical protein QW416_09280 [Candidatus Nitrosocaldaceae archaeon]